MVMYEVFTMIPDQILDPLLWLHYGHFVSLFSHKWILLFPLFSGKLWFVWSDIWHNVWNVPWGNCGNKEYHRQDSRTSLLRQELPEGANKQQRIRADILASVYWVKCFYVYSHFVLPVSKEGQNFIDGFVK